MKDGVRKARGGESFDIPMVTGTNTTKRATTTRSSFSGRPTDPPTGSKRPGGGGGAATTRKKTISKESKEATSSLIELGGDVADVPNPPRGIARKVHSAGSVPEGTSPTKTTTSSTNGGTATTNFPLRPSAKGALRSAGASAACSDDDLVATATSSNGKNPTVSVGAAAVENSDENDDTNWVYEAPPNNQRTFVFEEDGLAFSSEFDSGNLIQVERTGVYRYNLYICPDCGNTPYQTNNKQWFHFNIKGGVKGASITLTLVSVIASKMYTYNWTPVVATIPQRPTYQRMNTRVVSTKLDGPLQTPGYPDLMPKTIIPKNNSSSGVGTPTDPDDSDATPLMPPTDSVAMLAAGPPKKEKGSQYVNMTFEYKFDFDCPFPQNDQQCRVNNASTPAVYIAGNHPYSYARLQKHISNWSSQCANPPPCTSRDCGKDAGIYFHKEVLCKTLDGRNVDLLTISGVNGMSSSGDLEPMLHENFPFSGSVKGSTTNAAAQRAITFPKKQIVVLSARVHPGEAPASHMLHGCIEMLLNRNDPRAAALRQHFVFVIVPMINPDGVVRGHSRADTTGQNLNRMYRNPSEKKHPAIFGLKLLLKQLHSTGRMSLFIDMHAHANKKGAFFYGNAMKADDQVMNLLYAKLVSLNTPFFDFPACNFSETNMFAVGKNGEGKDSSSRVTVFQECGLVNCYTLESSYVVGVTQNGVAALPNIPGEEVDTLAGSPCPKYTQATFADLGRGLLVALLDMKGLNPYSRLPSTTFNHVRGVALWVQRALIVDAWEQVRKQILLRSGQSLTSGGFGGGGGKSSNTTANTNHPPVITSTSGDAPPIIDPKDLPAVITTRASKVFPPTTTLNIAMIASANERDSHLPSNKVSAACAPSSAAAAAAAAVNEMNEKPANTRSSAKTSRVFVAGAGAKAIAMATRDGAPIKSNPVQRSAAGTSRVSGSVPVKKKVPGGVTRN